jgi:dTDP-4-amino-4,6-dideoxygalactose transaminase
MSSVASSPDPQTRLATTLPQPQAAPAPFEFLDLKAQFATIQAEVMAAVTRVMESQHFIMGSEVVQFEQEIAAMLGAKHAIACASGSDALLLALMASGIGAGDEVITTPFTFIATGGAIARAGAKPVFVDIDPATFNIDPEKIEGAITPRTRAIMPVHLFGLAAEMDPIMALAQGRDIVVVEDAAQAIGASYRGRFVGTIGTYGCFSFFPSKNLGGAGDGGLVTTEDAALAERLRIIRVHGSKKKYHHDVLGTNSRLDALQAAILRAKLNHLEAWTSGREARAAKYRELFAAANLGDAITLPQPPLPGSRHVYNQFSIRCSRRDELREFLRASGIPTEIYYPLPLHLQPAFAYLGHKLGDFPHAEKASAEALALPVFPELKDSQQEAVVGAVARFYSRAN